MPAKSEKQRVAMAIALKSPDRLLKRNKGMLSMTKEQLSEYAHEPVAPKPKKKMARFYGDE